MKDSVATVFCLINMFQEYFGLPAEISSIILDHAAYWPSTTYSITRDIRSITGYCKMITTTPLGDEMSLKNVTQSNRRGRGRHPCRRIRIKIWARALGCPRDHRHPRVPPHRYTPPFTINIIWPNYDDNSLDIPERKRKERVFAPSNLQYVRSLPVSGSSLAGKEYSRWLIPVSEEPLSADEIEEKEVIWDWNDEGPGGDLVRSLDVGDALQIRSRKVMYPPALVVPRIEIEIYYSL